MPRFAFLQLDVFTRRAFGGNQLAVFTDARLMRPAEMQTLTQEMNFSECTFVLPPTTPGAVKQVRIFTPAMEMPMAGHPTVGTAAALVARGMAQPENGSLTLDLGIGPVQVDIEPGSGGMPFVWMNHRMPAFGPQRSDRAQVAAALGLEPADLDPGLPLEVVSTGVPFLFIPVTSLDAIGRARSEAQALARLFEGSQPAHVALFTRQAVDPNAAFHARMFSPHVARVVEDPATGSMAAPFGAYAACHGLVPAQPLVTFLIEQGLEMGRPSQISVEIGREGEAFRSIRIGGDSVIVGEGEIFWDAE